MTRDEFKAAMIAARKALQMSLQQSDVLAYMCAQKPVLLTGAPGLGKSGFVAETCRAIGFTLCDFRLALRESVDLRGIPVPDMESNVTRWLRPDDLPFEGSDWPDNTVLFLDEIGHAPQSLQGAAFGLVLERRIGKHALKPGVRIVAATNRLSDKAGAQRLNSALLNRFAHVAISADAKAWQAWARRSGVADIVRAFLAFRPGLLHLMPGARDETTGITIDKDSAAFPTPRAWHGVSEIVDLADDTDQLHRLAAGIVGDAPAHEFISFVRTYQSLPRIADIFAAPGSAIVPDNIGALYAVATALARACDRASVGAAFQYMARCGREFEALFATDLATRAPDLAQTSAFVAWAARNSDIALGVAA